MQVRAAAVDQQTPAIFIPEYLDVFVRDLPQKMAEVALAARRRDLLRNVVAALRARTESAFGLRRHLERSVRPHYNLLVCHAPLRPASRGYTDLM